MNFFYNLGARLNFKPGSRLRMAYMFVETKFTLFVTLGRKNINLKNSIIKPSSYRKLHNESNCDSLISNIELSDSLKLHVLSYL